MGRRNTLKKERHAAAGRALDYFRRTQRTEAAFYLRFQGLDEARRTALHARWPMLDEWGLLRRICWIYGVPDTPPAPPAPTPATPAGAPS